VLYLQIVVLLLLLNGHLVHLLLKLLLNLLSCALNLLSLPLFCCSVCIYGINPLPFCVVAGKHLGMLVMQSPQFCACYVIAEHCIQVR